MDFGVPLERKPDEFRVGLTPQGIQLLTAMGHRCYVERGAGDGAGFSDKVYESAGARIVYNPEEVYARADMVLKIGSPTYEEQEWMREGQIIAAWWHLAARSGQTAQAVQERGITALAYEQIAGPEGTHPVLVPLSQIAGRMAPQIAARWLQNDGGGNGVLLGGVAGVPPVEVAIIGGGVVGENAARAFLGSGARVFVLDISVERIKTVSDRLNRQATTLIAHDFNVARVLSFADVVVGAVLIPGMRTPQIITREMIRSMRDRSIFLDIAIDQGGCSETSRPTTHSSPTYIEEGVLHYCVPNMTAVVARTATQAFLNSAWPYIKSIAEHGLDAAIAADPGLDAGVAVRDGQIVNPSLAAYLKEN